MGWVLSAFWHVGISVYVAYQELLSAWQVLGITSFSIFLLERLSLPILSFLFTLFGVHVWHKAVTSQVTSVLCSSRSHVRKDSGITFNQVLEA